MMAWWRGLVLSGGLCPCKRNIFKFVCLLSFTTIVTCALMFFFKGPTPFPDEQVNLYAIYRFSKPLAATRNLPLKKEYVNGASSSNGLKHWIPANDSFRHFQPIDETDAWMYSTYFVHDDTHAPPFLVGIGLHRKPLPTRVICLYQRDGNIINVQTGTIRAYSGDQHSTSVVPANIKCPFPRDLRPDGVSFTFSISGKVTNSFPVIYHPAQRSYNFTVCYSVLHSNFSDTSQLIWSIETNRILGAEHFFLYNFSVSPKVELILRYYSNIGLLTVLPWPLPSIEAWYFSQVTALHDCLYRNKHLTKFTAFTDPDELIIPVKHFTWAEFFENIQHNECHLENCERNIRSKKCNSQSDTNKKKTSTEPPIGSFLFRNVFFHRNRSSEWKNITSSFISERDRNFVALHHILPLFLYRRSDRPFDSGKRSKMILKPETVQELGIHNPRVMNTRLGRAACVSPSAAMLHHYRHLDQTHANTITHTALRYTIPLLKRFKEVLGQLKNVTSVT